MAEITGQNFNSRFLELFPDQRQDVEKVVAYEMSTDDEKNAGIPWQVTIEVIHPLIDSVLKEGDDHSRKRLAIFFKELSHTKSEYLRELFYTEIGEHLLDEGELYEACMEALDPETMELLEKFRSKVNVLTWKKKGDRP